MVQRGVWCDPENLNVFTPDILRRGASIALIGGGGKTAVSRCLRERAAALGLRTVITTTTKIWPPADMPIVVGDDSDASDAGIRAHLDTWPYVTVARARSDDGKLLGVSPDRVPVIGRLPGVDLVLCEADGAAGCPLKVHGTHEPVIPGGCTDVFVVAGVDGVGMLPADRVVHRFPLYQRRFPHDPGTAISPRRVAEILLLAGERVPASARLVYVINKADGQFSRERAREIGAVIKCMVPAARIAVTSCLPLAPAGEEHPNASIRGAGGSHG